MTSAKYIYRSWQALPPFDQRLANYLGKGQSLAIEPDRHGYKLRTLQRTELRAFELGQHACAAERRENDFNENHKMDAIIGRAVEAMGYDKLGLMDFLEVYG